MMSSNEIFVSTDLIGMNGQLMTLSVDTEWQVRLEEETIELDLNAAFCLAAIITQSDRLLGLEERELALANLYDDAIVRGINPGEVVTKEPREVVVKKRKSAEYEILKRKYPFYPNLFSIGYVGSKRLMLCRNVSSEDRGIQIIEDFFEQADNTDSLEFNKSSFVKEYSIRERWFKSSGTDLLVPASALTEKAETTVVANIKDSVPKELEATTGRRKEVPVIHFDTKPSDGGENAKKNSAGKTKAKLEIENEITPTNPKIYANDLYKKIRELSPNASGFNIALLTGYLKSMGYKPKNSDIESIVRLAISQRIIRPEINTYNPEKAGIVVYFRI